MLRLRFRRTSNSPRDGKPGRTRLRLEEIIGRSGETEKSSLMDAALKAYAPNMSVVPAFDPESEAPLAVVYSGTRCLKPAWSPAELAAIIDEVACQDPRINVDAAAKTTGSKKGGEPG